MSRKSLKDISLKFLHAFMVWRRAGRADEWWMIFADGNAAHTFSDLMIEPGRYINPPFNHSLHLIFLCTLIHLSTPPPPPSTVRSVKSSSQSSHPSSPSKLQRGRTDMMERGVQGKAAKITMNPPVAICQTKSINEFVWVYILTINVPLFKKLRDIIIFAGQSLYEPFQGTFWGGQDFFDPLNCPERSQSALTPVCFKDMWKSVHSLPKKKISLCPSSSLYCGHLPLISLF